MKKYENGKVRITTAISDHCDQNGNGHPDKCLTIAKEVFPDIPWQFVDLRDGRRVFEAYVEPSVAKTHEMETS